MKNCIVTFFALLAVALPLQAQEIEKLSWMTGTWIQNKDGESVQESWLAARGKLMVGVNLTTSIRGATSFEYMRIAATPAGLLFIASPNEKTPTEFKLKELGDKRVVFENLKRDFPQRVMYWMEPDGAMKARIEGTVQGKPRGAEWRFEATK